jgi:hypothetical protein
MGPLSTSHTSQKSSAEQLVQFELLHSTHMLPLVVGTRLPAQVPQTSAAEQVVQLLMLQLKQVESEELSWKPEAHCTQVALTQRAQLGTVAGQVVAHCSLMRVKPV